MNISISLPIASVLGSKKISFQNFPKREIAIILSLFVIANSLFFGTPLTVQALYDGKIFPLVNIGAISVGGKTLAQAKSELMSDQSIAQQPVKVIVEGVEKTATLSELGVHESFDQVLGKAYQLGRSTSYRPITIERQYSLNEDRLKLTMTRFFGPQPGEAKNASIAIVKDTVEVTPSVSKRDFNWDSLKRQVMQAIAQPVSTIAVSITEVKPDITEAELQPAKEKVEQYLHKNITLSIDENSITIPKEAIGQWITINQDKTPAAVGLNEAKIQTYVAQLAKKYEIKPKTEIIVDDGTIEQEGIFGRQLNEKQVSTAIKSVLDGEQEDSVVASFTEVPFAQKIKTRGYTAGLYEGKYIEINLAEQKMYTFEGGNPVGAYPVSTGKWSMPTPEGEFAVNGKIDVAFSKRYNLYMPKWMSFIGSKYGIHGLPYWASGYVEGEDHLGKPVSHGCVRLSHADADIVYNWADVGTRVYIHK